MSERPCPAVCDRAGCGAPATLMPELRYWALGYPRDTHPPLSMALTIAVCDAHASENDARDLTDHHHAHASSYCLSTRRALPDKATAEVRWWRVDDAKAPHRMLWAKACPN